MLGGGFVVEDDALDRLEDWYAGNSFGFVPPAPKQAAAASAPTAGRPAPSRSCFAAAADGTKRWDDPGVGSPSWAPPPSAASASDSAPSGSAVLEKPLGRGAYFIMQLEQLAVGIMEREAADAEARALSGEKLQPRPKPPPAPPPDIEPLQPPARQDLGPSITVVWPNGTEVWGSPFALNVADAWAEPMQGGRRTTVGDIVFRIEMGSGRALAGLALGSPIGPLLNKDSTLRDAGLLQRGVRVVAVVAKEVRVCATSAAFALVRADGSANAWGDSRFGGDCPRMVQEQLRVDVMHLYSNDGAFAAVLKGGRVQTWGAPSHSGGGAPELGSALHSGVLRIVASRRAFAALKNDGTVATWAQAPGFGATIRGMLTAVRTVVATREDAFAALREDGRVVTWGNEAAGGNSSEVEDALAKGVRQVYAADLAFAALLMNGSVVAWGERSCGGSIAATVAKQLQGGVVEVVASSYAFCAIKADGSAVAWGQASSGGDSTNASARLKRGVRKVVATRHAFAALREDGSVVTWGGKAYGGLPRSNKMVVHEVPGRKAADMEAVDVSPMIASGVVQIFAADAAFAALKVDGSVVAWGDVHAGGHLGYNGRQLAAPKVPVLRIVAARRAFAALLSDGSVVCWGDHAAGGDAREFLSQLGADVEDVCASGAAFVAVKSDGSVVTWGDMSALVDDEDEADVEGDEEDWHLEQPPRRELPLTASADDEGLRSKEDEMDSEDTLRRPPMLQTSPPLGRVRVREAPQSEEDAPTCEPEVSDLGGHRPAFVAGVGSELPLHQKTAARVTGGAWVDRDAKESPTSSPQLGSKGTLATIDDRPDSPASVKSAGAKPNGFRNTSSPLRPLGRSPDMSKTVVAKIGRDKTEKLTPEEISKRSDAFWASVAADLAGPDTGAGSKSTDKGARGAFSSTAGKRAPPLPKPR